MYRMILSGLLALLLLPAIAQPQDSLALHYAATISEAGLRERLTILASDEFEGRETGTRGEKLAAAYIVDQFQAYGIPPIPDALDRGLLEDGYRQSFPLVRTTAGGLDLEVDGVPQEYMRDHFYFSERLKKDLQAAEVMIVTPVTAGGTRLGGGSKVVMMLDDGAMGNGLFADLRSLSATLQGTGTEVLLLVNDSAQWMMQRYGPLLRSNSIRLDRPGKPREGGGIQVIVITPELAQTIMEKGGLNMRKAARTAAKKRVVAKVPIAFTYSPLEERITGENVLGFVEGSDKKDEVVVVTAHYDHVGVHDGEVYNGADDDGSGTVAVMSMAEAFAKAKAKGHGPRRSVLFMAVSGEEKGLFGSEWYADHPVFPLDSTVANLNMDMIGRVDTVHDDSSSYVYVIGSSRISRELGRIVGEQNALYTGLELDYTFDAADDPNRFYYRSDHYNLAKHGVPAAFFFNGVHEDYHGPYDEVEKIRFDLLHKRTLLVFHTAWELANREDRPAKDGPEGSD